MSVCGRLFLICCFAPLSLFADPLEDATKLKDEALEILKANAVRQATPEQYATCIFKLEQAQAILEKSNSNDDALAREVSSSLFWARRFSNIQVLNALDKIRAGSKVATGPATPAKPAEPVRKPDAPKAPQTAKSDPPMKGSGGNAEMARGQATEKRRELTPDEPTPILARARQAFEDTKKFVDARHDDDYAVSLNWFKMAAEHTGTDYALKALELARQAQLRFLSKFMQSEEVTGDAPELKLVRDADALVAQGKLEESFKLYQNSLKQKETAIAHKKLGHAYFIRAQQLKEEFLPEFESLEARRCRVYKDAYLDVAIPGAGTQRRFNPNYPPLVDTQQQEAELNKKSVASLALYDKAHDEFRAVLRLVENKKDLDAAGHQALCVSVKSDPNARVRARQLLTAFTSEYAPANDVERALYEFCKQELERIR